MPVPSLSLFQSPDHTHTHTTPQVSMAHKVLSSDMTALVEAMKNAQKNYQTFLEADYQKQFLKAGHIVAVNSKQLLDAVNSARRKTQLMQRWTFTYVMFLAAQLQCMV